MCAGHSHHEACPGEAVNTGTRESSRSQGEEPGAVACVKVGGRTGRKEQGDGAERTQRWG